MPSKTFWKLQDICKSLCVTVIFWLIEYFLKNFLSFNLWNKKISIYGIKIFISVRSILLCISIWTLKTSSSAKGKSQKQAPLLSKQTMIKVLQTEHGQAKEAKNSVMRMDERRVPAAEISKKITTTRSYFSYLMPFLPGSASIFLQHLILPCQIKQTCFDNKFFIQMGVLGIFHRIYKEKQILQ